MTIKLKASWQNSATVIREVCLLHNGDNEKETGAFLFIKS